MISDEKKPYASMEPNKLDELLHPVFDEKAMKRATCDCSGTSGISGCRDRAIVFFADEADKYKTPFLPESRLLPKILKA